MFRHRTGREHATDFRRLPWSARVRTVRTGMQLYAGQEAGKSEMQAVKVNTRGTGFRYGEPRQLCALAVAAVGCAIGIQSREHLRFGQQWISLCRDCKERKNRERNSFHILSRLLTGKRQGSHHSSLKARLTPDSFRSAVSNVTSSQSIPLPLGRSCWK